MQCKSIYSLDERHSQCNMSVIDGDYCALHANKPVKIDYRPEYQLKNYKLARKTARYVNVFCPNTILFPQTSNGSNLKKTTHEFSNQSTTSKNEYGHSNFLIAFNNNECDLKIKLLILINEHKCDNFLADLIGPVYSNILDSVDEMDPVTLDIFWKIVDNERVDVYKNKYFLFSYLDSKNRVRCLTIFTFYNMYKNNQYIHPITNQQIPDQDILRGQKLISLYEAELNLFSTCSIENTPETDLINKTVSLFSSFNKFNIYYDSDWFTNITSIECLTKIFKEFTILIKNNLQDNKKIVELVEEKIVIKNSIHYKSEILSLWEKVVELVDLTKNQLPIWIIGYVISLIDNRVLLKYPTITNIAM